MVHGLLWINIELLQKSCMNCNNIYIYIYIYIYKGNMIFTVYLYVMYYVVVFLT